MQPQMWMETAKEAIGLPSTFHFPVHVHRQVRTHTPACHKPAKTEGGIVREFSSAHHHNHVQTSLRSQQPMHPTSSALAAANFLRPFLPPTFLLHHPVPPLHWQDLSNHRAEEARVPKDGKIMKEVTARLRGHQNNANKHT